MAGSRGSSRIGAIKALLDRPGTTLPSLAQELEAHPPNIYIRPDLRGYRTLHFFKADEIYREAQPAKEQLERQLGEAVEASGRG